MSSRLSRKIMSKISKGQKKARVTQKEVSQAKSFLSQRKKNINPSKFAKASKELGASFKETLDILKYVKSNTEGDV